MGSLATRPVVPRDLRSFRAGLDGPGGGASPELATVQVADDLIRGSLADAGRHLAQAAGLSVNTVSTHTRHLYAKLGVHSRHEAVDRARALGLLAPSTRRAQDGITTAM